MRFEEFFCHGRRRHHNSRDGAQTEKHNGSVFPCQRRERLMRKVSQEMEISYNRPWTWSWSPGGSFSLLRSLLSL
ncbi:hypothetical protein SUGI_0639700 [Cryptomeria japonica]|nr:hypothetical protein SUGI_0639700 [Cryptomeria japonica]